MNITILGTGHMARTLGGGLRAAGHDLVFGSRNPDQHADTRDLPGPVRGHLEAIAHGEVVISALAAAYSLDTLTGLEDALAGRILVDLGNAVDERMELIYPDSSLGERLQTALPRTRVVKSLNTVPGTVTVDPGQLSAPTTVFLSGDDAQSKQVVAGLLADLGWSPERQIDLGDISTARAAEHYFLLFAGLMGALRDASFNIAVIRR